MLVLGTSQLNLVFPSLDSTSFLFSQECSSALISTLPSHFYHLTVFSFIWPCCAVCKILIPQPGSNPCLLQWKCGVLTSEPQGIPVVHLIFALILLSWLFWFPAGCWAILQKLFKPTFSKFLFSQLSWVPWYYFGKYLYIFWANFLFCPFL